MNILPFCITTSDENSIKWLVSSISSFTRYHNETPKVFCIENADNVKIALSKFNVEIIELKINFDDYINKNEDKFLNVTKSLVPLNCILAFPYILDYIFKNYNYDIAFKFDTDTLFLSEVDFKTFYNSNKAYGGCYDKLFRIWTDTLKLNFTPIFKDIPINSGLTMFRKDKQPSNMYEKTIKVFEDYNFKVVCYEQDAFNKIFENDKFDLNYQFGMNCNTFAVHRKSVFSAMHFCARNKDMTKLFDPFKKFENERIIELKDNRYFAWTKPFYNALKEEFDNNNIENFIPHSTTFINRKLKTPKVAFFSTIIGNIKKYCNFAKVTMQTYDNTNTLDVEWLITANTEDELNTIKLYMNNKYKHITLKYMLLPKTYGIEDYSKYNQLNWVSDLACQLFTDRIAFVDDVQDLYDVLVCVDLDIIFRADISKYILDFYNSPFKLGGQTEVNYSNYNLIQKGITNLTNEKYYNPHYYVNFGFGMIHCKNMHKDHWKTFLDISKNHEYAFSCQEQLYFAVSSEEKRIKHYDNLQLLVYVKIDTRSKRGFTENQPLIHYTRSNYLGTEFNANEVTDLKLHIVVLAYYNVYYNAVLDTPNLDEEFINLIKSNNEKISKFIKTNKQFQEYKRICRI